MRGTVPKVLVDICEGPWAQSSITIIKEREVDIKEAVRTPPPMGKHQYPRGPCAM